MTHQIFDKGYYSVWGKTNAGPKEDDHICFKGYCLVVPSWRKEMKAEAEKRGQKHIIFETSSGWWNCLTEDEFDRENIRKEAEEKGTVDGDGRKKEKGADDEKKKKISEVLKSVLIMMTDEEIRGVCINWGHNIYHDLAREGQAREGKLGLSESVVRKWWEEEATQRWFKSLGGTLQQFIICCKMKTKAPNDLKPRLDPRSKYDANGRIVKGRFSWAKYRWPEDEKEKEEAEHRG